MTYTDLLRTFYEQGYDRVERDDRLLDVFVGETREKGVELWERWEELDIKVVRVRLPFDEENVELFVLARPQVESLLRRNFTASLADFDRHSLAELLVE